MADKFNIDVTPGARPPWIMRESFDSESPHRSTLPSDRVIFSNVEMSDSSIKTMRYTAVPVGSKDTSGVIERDSLRRRTT